MSLFTGTGGEFSRTCIQSFTEIKFTNVFGIDASTITGDKSAPVQLDVNLSQLVDRNFSIQVIETTSLTEAMFLDVVGKDKVTGQPVVFESNYKQDRTGERILDENGKAIYRKSFLREYNAEMVDILVRKIDLSAISENAVESAVVETAVAEKAK